MPVILPRIANGQRAPVRKAARSVPVILPATVSARPKRDGKVVRCRKSLVAIRHRRGRARRGRATSPRIFRELMTYRMKMRQRPKAGSRWGRGARRLTFLVAVLSLFTACHVVGYNPDRPDSHGTLQKPPPAP
jgi:hypothetical protein